MPVASRELCTRDAHAPRYHPPRRNTSYVLLLRLNTVAVAVYSSLTLAVGPSTRGRVLRILPNHHEHIGDGAFVQQELTRHSSYLRRSVEREVVHTCHPIKSDGQRLAGDTCGKSGAALFGSKETLTCRFRPNVGSSEHLQERRETPARPLVEAC